MNVELVWVEQTFEVAEGQKKYRVKFTSSEKGQQTWTVTEDVYHGEEIHGMKATKIVNTILNSKAFANHGFKITPVEE